MRKKRSGPIKKKVRKRKARPRRPPLFRRQSYAHARAAVARAHTRESIFLLHQRSLSRSWCSPLSRALSPSVSRAFFECVAWDVTYTHALPLARQRAIKKQFYSVSPQSRDRRYVVRTEFSLSGSATNRDMYVCLFLVCMYVSRTRKISLVA